MTDDNKKSIVTEHDKTKNYPINCSPGIIEYFLEAFVDPDEMDRLFSKSRKDNNV